MYLHINENFRVDTKIIYYNLKIIIKNKMRYLHHLLRLSKENKTNHIYLFIYKFTDVGFTVQRVMCTLRGKPTQPILKVIIKLRQSLSLDLQTDTLRVKTKC